MTERHPCGFDDSIQRRLSADDGNVALSRRPKLNQV